MLKKIQENLKKAQKEKDELKVLTLRQFLSNIKNASIEKKQELNEQEINQIALGEIKKRKESIELYKKGNRDDLAQKEEKEIKILELYLPEMLSEAEIGEIVEKTINDLGAQGPADFGKIMGLVMAKTKGKALGEQVSTIVKQKLGLQ